MYTQVPKQKKIREASFLKKIFQLSMTEENIIAYTIENTLCYKVLKLLYYSIKNHNIYEMLFFPNLPPIFLLCKLNFHSFNVPDNRQKKVWIKTSTISKCYKYIITFIKFCIVFKTIF